jgi:acetyl-CoA carboxylase biotin carboxylase subunit
MEKYLQTPRHVEIQVAADDHGNAVHFFERDCSIQRRNQKIIEEAPAFDIPQEKLDEIRNIAVNTCKKINYKGLGTFEFLYENGNFYFIEMNTRLQVEHTITEMITGIDLVKLQIMIAAGQEIPLSQEDINCRGHAIECRINAEHHETFIPSPGKVTEFHPPGGFRIRTDSHLYSGYTVPQYYDALIAKICAHSSDRISAIRKMRVALEETYIEGINTNAPLHQRILIEPNFVEEKISINYLRDILNIK